MASVESVLAHYRKINVLSRTLVFLAVAVPLYALTLPDFTRESVGQYLARSPSLIPLEIFAWITGPFVFWAMLIVIKRLLFENGKAVWIEDGTLIFLHKWNISAPCRNIAEISIGTYGRFNRPGIILVMRDGTKKSIPTGGLSEPADVVLARVRASVHANSQ